MMTFKKALLRSIGLLFSIFFITTFFNEKLFAQFQTDYPFKAISDDDGYIYVTGEIYNFATNTFDIFIKKIDPSTGNTLINDIYPSSAGNDKGYALAIDGFGKVIVTGSLYNSSTNSEDIIILKYYSNSWHLDTLIESPDEDRGLSVTIVNFDDFAVCGYITNTTTGKDSYTYFKRSDINKSWSFLDDLSSTKLDDIATTILADASYLYVGGYGNFGGEYYNDLIFSDYDVPQDAYDDSGLLSMNQYIPENRVYTDEKLTSYALTDISQSADHKSKRAVTASLENIPISPGNEDYLTLRINTELTTSIIVWDTIWGEPDYRDIPTATTSDNDYIYVTGYAGTVDEGYNFQTLQYKKDNPNQGSLEGEAYYDDGYMDDRASSIRLSKGFLFVTGYSEGATGEYTIATYDVNEFNDNSEDSSTLKLEWKKNYVPELQGINLKDFKKYTYCAGDSNGNVTMMVFGYNDDAAFYGGQTYDLRGNIKSTITPVISRKFDSEINKEPEGIIFANSFPNPFNPETTIQFKIAFAGLVEMEIYDITGRKIESLLRKNLTPGVHEVKWNASRVSSGTYFYTIKANNQIITKRLVVIK